VTIETLRVFHKSARSRRVTAGVLVFGPGAAIERILSSMDRSVRWNLPIDDAVPNELRAALSELQRAGQAAVSRREESR
jgi:hypothetical protein